MRRMMLAFAAALVAGASVPALAQEGMPPMGPPDEIRKMAEETVGTWDVAMKYQGPDGTWEETKGVAVITAILDGCAVQMDFQTTMMGMPMHGVSTTLYDRETKEWVETWMDNMSARLSVYRGGYQGSDFVTQGEDFMQGQKMLSRNTVSNRAKDRFEWKAEMSMDGGKIWMTWGTAVYTRRK